MAAYEQSPQDEGYSEAPLSVGTVLNPPPPSWLGSMTISEQTGRPGLVKAKHVP